MKKVVFFRLIVFCLLPDDETGVAANLLLRLHTQSYRPTDTPSFHFIQSKDVFLQTLKTVYSEVLPPLMIFLMRN